MYANKQLWARATFSACDSRQSSFLFSAPPQVSSVILSYASSSLFTGCASFPFLPAAREGKKSRTKKAKKDTSFKANKQKHLFYCTGQFWHYTTISSTRGEREQKEQSSRQDCMILARQPESQGLQSYGRLTKMKDPWHIKNAPTTTRDARRLLLKGEGKNGQLNGFWIGLVGEIRDDDFPFSSQIHIHRRGAHRL